MSHFSPEILKHEMKVFFVKYNDPIYVKLEKLDIMIRLASQANIAQVTHPQLIKWPQKWQWHGFILKIFFSKQEIQQPVYL